MNKALLTILACPVCTGKLVYHAQPKELICKFDRLAFAIKNDIPVLLQSEAREISLEEKEALK